MSEKSFYFSVKIQLFEKKYRFTINITNTHIIH